MAGSGSCKSGRRVQRVGEKRVWTKSPKGNGATSCAMDGSRRKSPRLNPQESGTTTSSVPDGDDVDSPNGPMEFKAYDDDESIGSEDKRVPNISMPASGAAVEHHVKDNVLQFVQSNKRKQSPLDASKSPTLATLLDSSPEVSAGQEAPSNGRKSSLLVSKGHTQDVLLQNRSKAFDLEALSPTRTATNNRPEAADFGRGACRESSSCGWNPNNEAIAREAACASSEPQHDVCHEPEPTKSRPISTPLPETVHNKTISPSNDETTIVQHKDIWSLASVQATGGTDDVPKAAVKMVSSDGEEKTASSDGTCFVDAAYKAVNQIIKIPVVVREYKTSITQGGIDAMATTRVVVDVTANASNNAAIHALTGKSFSGSGESRDIVVSSVTAYLNALNEICSLISGGADEMQALKEENARLKEEIARLMQEKEAMRPWYGDVYRATAHLQSKLMSAPGEARLAFEHAEYVRGLPASAGNVLHPGSWAR